jgi:hypothetical protein
MSTTAGRRLMATGLACVAAAAVLAPSAAARPLDMGRAEQAARAVTAPEPVVGAVCVPATTPSRSSGRRRALCLVAHPAPDGTICRSLVSVRGSRNGPSAKVIRRVCLTVPQDLRPEFPR